MYVYTITASIGFSSPLTCEEEAALQNILGEKELAKEFAREFYRSKTWQMTRSAYAASVGRLCEECLRKGIYKAGEIVHHKQELTADNIDNPSIALAWDNLELLCRDCHGKAHKKRRRYKVDPAGRVTTEL